MTYGSGFSSSSFSNCAANRLAYPASRAVRLVSSVLHHATRQHEREGGVGGSFVRSLVSVGTHSPPTRFARMAPHPIARVEVREGHAVGGFLQLLNAVVEPCPAPGRCVGLGPPHGGCRWSLVRTSAAPLRIGRSPNRAARCAASALRPADVEPRRHPSSRAVCVCPARRRQLRHRPCGALRSSPASASTRGRDRREGRAGEGVFVREDVSHGTTLAGPA